jgi:hypothetical protein
MRGTAILATIIILLPAIPLSAQTPHPGVNLLEELNGLFEKIAGEGFGESEATASLDKLMEQATSLRESGRIDPAFMRRFHRLLFIIRLSLVTDRSGILKPLVDREFGTFIKDATGEKYDPKGSVTKQIVQFSEAVSSEILSLYGTVREK